MQAVKARPVLTSLPLEILLYFGAWWDALYWLLELLVYVYKGLTLPYPADNFAAEFVFVWLFLLVEPTRLFLASKGNKTEQAAPLLLSLLLALPVAAFFVYFMMYSTFVLRIELIINAASLAFCGAQALLGAASAARFAQAARYG